MQTLLIQGVSVGAYAFEGPWFDIGHEGDYARAVEAWTSGEFEDASRTRNSSTTTEPM